MHHEGCGATAEGGGAGDQRCRRQSADLWRGAIASDRVRLCGLFAWAGPGGASWYPRRRLSAPSHVLARLAIGGRV
jgi:hypothetical protein